MTVAQLLAKLQDFGHTMPVELYHRTKDIPFQIIDYEIRDVREESGAVAIILARKDD